jgi:hypothetical protein
MKIRALPFDMHIKRTQELVEAYSNPLIMDICQLINEAKGFGLQLFELKVCSAYARIHCVKEANSIFNETE